MGKQGRGRRTAEARLAAKDNRSSVVYVMRLKDEALIELVKAGIEEKNAEAAAETVVKLEEKK